MLGALLGFGGFGTFQAQQLQQNQMSPFGPGEGLRSGGTLALTFPPGFGSGVTTTSNTITVEPGTPVIPTKESALAWLDRRIDEMRVKL